MSILTIIQPRELEIAQGDDESCWKWFRFTHGSAYTEEVAKLIKVRTLDIKGKIDMSRLLEGETYRVYFIMKVENDAKGWDQSPVNLALYLPDGTSKSTEMKLDPKNEQINIIVGEFVAKAAGDVVFRMTETRSLNWKSGLIIYSVFCEKR